MRKALLLHGMGLGAAAASILGMMRPASPFEVIANRGQALPKGALDAVRGSRSDRRRELRQVTRELASSQGIVLGHIHPRWLRAEVEAKLDEGYTVDAKFLERRRVLGPHYKTARVCAYCNADHELWGGCFTGTTSTERAQGRG